MNNFISKIWKLKGGIYFLALWLAATFAAFPEMSMTLNGMSSSVVRYAFSFLGSAMPFSLKFTKAYAVGYCFVTGLTVAFFSFVFIKISQVIFGAVYARSYGRFATVNELPIDRSGLGKIMALYAIICDILLGLVRLIFYFVPISYLLIENVVKPLVFGIMFFPFFFLIRKYFLEGRVTYNVLLALSVPFIIFLIMFC